MSNVNPDQLEQAAEDLEQVLEATENVDWANVPEISISDVAKWNQRLQYARKCAIAELEKQQTNA
ncbi:hypothetical protein [Natrinema hispanicum]|uniref:Uncharacterized protein n=1 Tax=Natrinema hispanicum TaxID=392421 RepID=A0A1I0IW21_9EURY|nr:hypothetical protein [Natrinema hispanicum]SEU00731.1 hypothetical protein SAMN04488694_1264 [Natrinema hispanicum]